MGNFYNLKKSSNNANPSLLPKPFQSFDTFNQNQYQNSDNSIYAKMSLILIVILLIILIILIIIYCRKKNWNNVGYSYDESGFQEDEARVVYIR